MSTDEGRRWIQVVARAPWVGRGDAQAEITATGVMIVTGGYANLAAGQSDNLVLNDVWASLDGGYSWGLCSENAEFSDRRYPYTVLDDDGTLFVMGGRERVGGVDALTNDVWRSNFKFSDPAAVAAYCHLRMPTCGKVGLQCLPSTAPEDAFDQGLWGATCSQCPMLSGSTDGGSTSSSSSNPLVIALVVFVLAFVLSLAVIVYYYYRLKEAGVDVSKISKQQPWNKANGGSDPLMMDDGHSTVTGAL
jgi:hypothetical protein